MTLQEWSDKYGILPTTATGTGAVTLATTVGTLAYRELYTLSDYKVGDVAGPVVWLVPVKPAYRLEVNTGGGWTQEATAHTGLVDLIQLATDMLRADNGVLAVRIVGRDGEIRLHLGLLEI